MKVSIVMGSISDKNIGEKVVKTLKEFGVDYEVKVISAHRSLDYISHSVFWKEILGIISCLKIVSSKS